MPRKESGADPSFLLDGEYKNGDVIESSFRLSNIQSREDGSQFMNNDEILDMQDETDIDWVPVD